MTADAFRELALSLEDVVEGAHMGHPDFRVGGRIFATLSVQSAGKGMLKLPLEEQATLCAAEPKMFVPVPGGWGRAGCTHLLLENADARNAELALRIAWATTREKGASRSKRRSKTGRTAAKAEPSRGI